MQKKWQMYKMHQVVPVQIQKIVFQIVISPGYVPLI